MLPRTELFELVQSVLAEVSGLNETEIAADVPMVDIGIDEDCYEDIAADLEDTLERPIPATELFTEDVTMDTIVDRLEVLLNKP